MPRLNEGDAVQYRRFPLGPWLWGHYAYRDGDGKHHVKDDRGNVLQVVSISRADKTPQEPEAPAPSMRKAASLQGRIPPAEPITVRTTGNPVAVPRPAAPFESASYKAWVRAMPCCSCAAPAPSDPHHYGPRGVGQKTDDLRVVPLCRACHDHFHGRGYLPAHVAREETRVFLLAVQVDLLVRWVRGERL